jgi:predicted acetyltransferase
VITLEPPSATALAAYTAALETGWSPNTLRDVSGEQLTAIRTDPQAFLAGLAATRGGGTIRLGDGTEVPRLPGHELWIWDGDFCGRINLRYQLGTEALPPWVSGHIGYSVVPWKRRRGYATEALRQVLPLARAAGLAWVELTCSPNNPASRRVIEANGGALVDRRSPWHEPDAEVLVFRLHLGP